jgi:hypothetical protein
VAVSAAGRALRRFVANVGDSRFCAIGKIEQSMRQAKIQTDWQISI